MLPKLSPIRALTIGILFNFYYAQAQFTTTHVFEEWNKQQGLTTYAYRSNSTTDSQNNIYVVGGTLSANNDYDWLLTKYDEKGGVIWSVQYDGGINADDYLVDLYVDINKNIFVTGVLTTDTAQGYDLALAMYDSTGTQQWVSTYDNGLTTPYNRDGGTDIDLDTNGYIYVSGFSEGDTTMMDMLILQFDMSGVQKWVRRYDHNQLTDVGGKVAVYMGAIYCLGSVANSMYNNMVYAVGYDTTGTVVAQIPLSSTYSDTLTEIHDITRADNGDFYIVGYVNSATNGKHTKLIKLGQAQLVPVWSQTLNTSGDNEGNIVRTDSHNHIYVGGYTTQNGTQKDYNLLKYDTAGTLIWQQTYNSQDSLDDIITGIVIDSDDNPIVTGYSSMIGNMDYYTIKYDTGGTKVWEINYNSKANKDDYAQGIGIDNAGDIYVFGQSGDPGGGLSYTYKTVKYTERELYKVYDADTIPGGFDITANPGQLLNTDTTVNTTVKYYTTTAFPSTYFTPNTIHYLLTKIDTSAATNDTVVRIDMLLNSDTTQQLFSLGKRKWYSNYYLPHTQSTGGLCRVPSYEKICYPGIYSGVDLYSTANVKGIKNQFQILPHSSTKPSNIQFSYSGMDTIYIDGSGSLVLVTALDTIKFMPPVCSLTDSGGNYMAPLSSSIYTLTDSTVSFTDGSYNSSYPYTIEMNQGTGAYSIAGGGDNLEWSTYYGTNKKDRIHDIAEKNGSIFLYGETGSDVLPTSPGTVINSSYLGATDVFYVKFDPNETIEHITYYGGYGGEFAKDIAVERYIAIVGYTFSNTFFPNYSNSGINYNTFQGSSDGFFVALKPDGTLIMCDSYIGGNDNSGESCTGVDISSTYPYQYAIVGNTQGFSGFPLLNSGGYYQGPKPLHDGYIIKLDNNFNLTWSTIFGTNSNDFILDVAMDNDRLVVYGVTSQYILSTDDVSNPTCSAPSDGSFPNCVLSGAYNQSSYGGGGRDYFVAEFSSTDQLIWSTLLGTDGTELETENGLTLSSSNEIYITGGVYGSASGIPFNKVTSTSYSQTTYNDPSSVIISKFNSNRELNWFTLYGGEINGTVDPGSIIGNDITVSSNGTIFITGSCSPDLNQSITDYCTEPSSHEFPICDELFNAYIEADLNTSNTPTSFPSHYQRTFIAAFNNNAEIIWSTRFGNGTENYGTALVVDETNKKLFISGTATDNIIYTYTLRDLPGMLDYFDNSYNGNDDGVIARFSLDDILSINDYNSDLKLLSVFPNPAKDYITIKYLNEFENSDVILEIFNASGKLINIITTNNINNFHTLDISNLSNGLYFLRISNSYQIFNGKFIKQ